MMFRHHAAVPAVPHTVEAWPAIARPVRCPACGATWLAGWAPEPCPQGCMVDVGVGAHGTLWTPCIGEPLTACAAVVA